MSLKQKIKSLKKEIKREEDENLIIHKENQKERSKQIKRICDELSNADIKFTVICDDPEQQQNRIALNVLGVELIFELTHVWVFRCGGYDKIKFYFGGPNSGAKEFHCLNYDNFLGQLAGVIARHS